MSREALNALLAELGESAGLDTLSLDDDGSCILRLGQVLVQLEYWQDDALLCLFCPLQDIPNPGKEQMAALLDANVLFSGTGKATLGLAAGTGLVTLQRLVALEGLDLPAFQRVLEGFVATAEQWQRQLAAAPSEAGDSPDAPPSEPPPSMLV